MLKYNFKRAISESIKILRGRESESKYYWSKSWSDLIHPLRCVRYATETFWAYKGILWCDRDWDYCFLLDMLEMKFKRMADLHRIYGNSMNSNKYAKQLETASLLCARICEDKYDDEMMEQHDKKWGESQMAHLPAGEHLTEMRFLRHRVRNDKEAAQERKEFLCIIRKGESAKNRDIKKLTKIINDNLLCWWD